MIGLGVIDCSKPVRRDVYERARLFDPASFTHHGKANLNVVQAILDRFTEPGDLVFDPLAGTGSVLVGLLTGRRVAAGDIEVQWARLLGRNLALCRQSLIAFGTPGLAARWDAARLPLAGHQVDLCLTSPPYFDTWSDWDVSGSGLGELENEHGLAYGLDAGQIANIHVYEEYLRAMGRVYSEIKRVVRPGGKLVLILKDVIRGGRRVPVVEDNLTLATTAGFRLWERLDVPVRGSRFRNINRERGLRGPQRESILVLNSETARRARRRLALVELPQAHDGPGWVIARKAVGHAGSREFEVWVRAEGDYVFGRLSPPLRFPPGGGEGQRLGMKARQRRELAFGMVRDLVANPGLRVGDEVAFYGSERFGKYLCMRLETLGLAVTQVLRGLNNGQRLAWLTQRLGIQPIGR